MQPIGNWATVEASNGGGGIIAPGVYTVKVTKVSDHTDEAKPYLNVVFDIYDREARAFRFQGVAADERQDFRHSFRFYVGTEFGMARYKKLVESCEGSAANRGFSYDPTVPGHERQLVGMWCAMAIGHRAYLNRNGEERTDIDLAGCHTIEEAEAGGVPVPGLRDERGKGSAPQREAAPAPQCAAEYYAGAR